MNAGQLFRLSGAAAIAGGALRIFSAFALLTDPIQQQWLWVIVDIFVTLGLIGIYVSRAEKLGFLGLASFIVGMAALSFMGGPDADPFGFSTYEQGAMTLVIALIGLSLAWVRAGECADTEADAAEGPLAAAHHLELHRLLALARSGVLALSLGEAAVLAGLAAMAALAVMADSE